jgi:hypothetical protein
MNTLHEIEQALSDPTCAEKPQRHQGIARDPGDAFPGIESTPGVSGDPGQSRGSGAGSRARLVVSLVWFS